MKKPIEVRNIKLPFGKFLNLFIRFFAKLREKIRNRKKKGIYYINGPEVLPPPLSREEEAEVIDRLKFDEEAKQILIEHNLRLVVYIAKRFENTGIGIEDLVSIGTVGLIKSINTFCADKNIKLATYASRCHRKRNSDVYTQKFGTEKRSVDR